MKNYILGTDTETTGLLVSKAAPLSFQPYVTEVAFIFLNKKLKIKDEWEQLFKIPIPVPQYITAITGIDDDLLRNEKKIGHYLKAMKKIIQGASLLFGHNIQFDANMIEIEFKRHGMKIKFPPLFCTIEQSRFMHGQRLTNKEAYELVTKKIFEKSHRAMPDIKTTYKIFRELYK